MLGMDMLLSVSRRLLRFSLATLLSIVAVGAAASWLYFIGWPSWQLHREQADFEESAKQLKAGMLCSTPQNSCVREPRFQKEWLLAQLRLVNRLRLGFILGATPVIAFATCCQNTSARICSIKSASESRHIDCRQFLLTIRNILATPASCLMHISGIFRKSLYKKDPILAGIAL